MPKIKILDKEIDIKAVIFDKDGTLVDFVSFWYKVVNLRLKYIIKQVSCMLENKRFDFTNFKKRIHYIYGTELVGKVRADAMLTLSSRYDSAIGNATILYETLQPYGLDWTKCRKIVFDSFDMADKMILESDLKIIPGTIELIRDLYNSGIKIGIASTDEFDNINKFINNFGLGKYIKYIIGADKVKNPKPYPDMINILCSQMNVKPEEVIMVGDGLNDMKMGKLAGVKASVGVLTGLESKENLNKIADFVLDSISQINVVDENNDKEIRPLTATIYTDGASKGNPGPSGIGVVIVDDNNKIIKEINEFIGVTTNNVAEYMALITGLKNAIDLGIKNVKLRSDSELLVKQINEEYKVRNEKLIPLFYQVKDLLNIFDYWEIKHIQREENQLADKLSNIAINTYCK